MQRTTVSKTFEVGPRTCTVMVFIRETCGGLTPPTCCWHPDAPTGLTRDEFRQFETGHTEVMDAAREKLKELYPSWAGEVRHGQLNRGWGWDDA